MEEWLAKHPVNRKMPLKLRRYFEMVTAAEEQKRREAELKAERDRMNFYSRERQGAGLPSDPILRLIKDERAKSVELEDESTSDSQIPEDMESIGRYSLTSLERQDILKETRKADADLRQEKEIAALEEKDTEKPGLKLPPIF